MGRSALSHISLFEAWLPKTCPLDSNVVQRTRGRSKQAGIFHIGTMLHMLIVHRAKSSQGMGSQDAIHLDAMAKVWMHNHCRGMECWANVSISHSRLLGHTREVHSLSSQTPRSFFQSSIRLECQKIVLSLELEEYL